jgi:CMP/dCMP kinase
VIITIDGPAGTGKSTVAHLLARRLGLECLDTGAMYRALTLLVLEAGADPRDREGVERAVRDVEVRFDFEQDPPELLVNGRAVGEAIRTVAVTNAVSLVAGHTAVRTSMVEAQRSIAASHPHLVTEGRDQGSYVFPHADLKFYLDASVEIRAARRAEQLFARGEMVDIDLLRQAIEERDRNDRARSMGALMRPADAIELDTGPLTVAEVVESLAELALARVRSVAYAEDADEVPA